MRKPALLSSDHRIDEFDSGKPMLDGFLKEVALYNQQHGYTRTFVIADTDQKVVGYYSLCAGMMSRDHMPRRMKGHPSPKEIPLALLARLAVSRSHQGRGIGKALLKNALLMVASTSQSVAFRAVVVHAIDDEAERFYLKHGFCAAKGLERTLLLPIQDIEASLPAST
nr:GNAT family N-acetyltransferase [Rhizobium herbae]